MNDAAITALFDGRCVLCQSTRFWFQRLDWLRRIRFVDLHDTEQVEAVAPDLDHQAMMGEIHVLTDDGLYRGYAGVRRMLREVPLGVPVWALLHLPGMGRLGPRLYGFIARHRYRINRWLGVELDEDCADDVCKMPQ